MYICYENGILYRIFLNVLPFYAVICLDDRCVSVVGGPLQGHLTINKFSNKLPFIIQYQLQSSLANLRRIIFKFLDLTHPILFKKLYGVFSWSIFSALEVVCWVRCTKSDIWTIISHRTIPYLNTYSVVPLLLATAKPPLKYKAIRFYLFREPPR